MKKTALVCGAGGFIGGHLVKRLKNDGFWVRGVDIKEHEHAKTQADEFIVGDLRDQALVTTVLDRGFDEVYQLAADMGGAGYLFTGENDANVMHNSMQINLNVLDAGRRCGVKRLFYASSACVYPEYNQEDPDNPNCAEDTVYPANPDSEYGWEKLFSERLYMAFNRNYGMQCSVARYHNIYGLEGTWTGGKEKVPAALCRKVASAAPGSEIEVWGDGLQSRSFLFVDDCIEATVSLLRSDFQGPVNIGSEEMISINDLAKLIIEISGKDISINNVPGPEGVRGRNSDNRLIADKLDWQPRYTLREGIEKTFTWIQNQHLSLSK
ncbi:NAD-dependent epimerase/dehydratase family protein [Alisedimentitalea sp. MJ-SS2]|uniref:NAD-dependent epimerase/dehydratase family protein n=1 Tax=Aliisedimentitalea sp. MJ-SS2 TaxID=3049795 RepID=UPI0029117CF9|nr:NAD-dependent epimerase/dehydratase family protein [Alisedimentitalea sp. MJ-SS2]MDU8929666.1 NAD-dependent epimerase/dehydratase family protein [Alisedimentitalea sp. MJ-SS2]